MLRDVRTTWRQRNDEFENGDQGCRVEGGHSNTPLQEAILAGRSCKAIHRALWTDFIQGTRTTMSIRRRKQRCVNMLMSDRCVLGSDEAFCELQVECQY